MTSTSIVHRLPKKLIVSSYVNTIHLIVRGQGVLIFDASGPCTLSFCDASGAVGLRVQFTGTSVLVNLEPSHKPLLDKANTTGLSTKQGAYYWVSLDAQNECITAGIGEARAETVTYYYELPHNSASKSFLESLVTVRADNLRITTILRDPITRCVPLLIKDMEELTMKSIALGLHMPKANLSSMSQKLYNCIAGKHFRLDTPDFPQFTKAIEYSLATPGKWCYERIKQKANEFSKDKPNYQETYLRITLGENNGESPGIPYVMEIWPVGHYSPIHNHGGSSAIIRVLNGSIQVSLFAFLSEETLQPFAVKPFKKGDITWISPTLNQVHQLKNLETNKDTCITIQCYMYENDNTTHYDYFDYIDAENKQQAFEPDSDMEFIEFKNTMKKEWATRPRPWWRCF